MNRQELFESLAGMLNKFIREPDNTKNTDALVAALNQLRPASPDPATGLVPCGCGGQAVFEGSFLDEEVPSSYRVSLSCVECGISTIAYEYEQEAMKAWNTAMGWKGGAE